MDIESWISKLRALGFKDALAHPNATVAFYVVFVVLRWIAIAAAFSVIVALWVIFSIFKSLFKSL